MHYCDYCGEEILGSPYRRKKHYYCSQSCADGHEFEWFGGGEEDDDMERELEEDEGFN